MARRWRCSNRCCRCFSASGWVCPASQIGLLFGVAAVGLIVMPIVYGPLVGTWGSRRLVRLGLILMAVGLPMLALAVGVKSALR